MSQPRTGGEISLCLNLHENSGSSIRFPKKRPSQLGLWSIRHQKSRDKPLPLPIEWNKLPTFISYVELETIDTRVDGAIQ